MGNIPGTEPTCSVPFERGAELCRVCRLSTEFAGLKRCSRLVAESEAMRTLLARAAPVARSDASVVILGESGVGKEVLARAFHVNSPRKSKPFLAVNVAALPADLLESELFGHARGAFTGATSDKHGLFEAADGGSLFLDEIAEMPLSLQAKLLRVLQDGEVRRVGETRTFGVDVRILCATNRDLRGAVAEGAFRSDLFYRLNVFRITVPPLRERREDIPVLAETFLAQEGHPTGRLTPAALEALLSYSWPGNIRELANAVKHGVILSRGEDVDLEHLPDEVVRPVPERRSAEGAGLLPLAQVERAHVLKVLEIVGGNQVEAARVLGIGRTTLWRKLQAFGVRARAR